MHLWCTAQLDEISAMISLKGAVSDEPRVLNIDRHDLSHPDAVPPARNIASTTSAERRLHGPRAGAGKAEWQQHDGVVVAGSLVVGLGLVPRAGPQKAGGPLLGQRRERASVWM